MSVRIFIHPRGTVGMRMSDIDADLAVRAAQLVERELVRLDGIPSNAKARRQAVMRAWGFVHDTNAWHDGDAAFDVLVAKTDDALAYWCWYTALALDLCKGVRTRAAEWGVPLPQVTQ